MKRVVLEIDCSESEIMDKEMVQEIRNAIKEKIRKEHLPYLRERFEKIVDSSVNNLSDPLYMSMKMAFCESVREIVNKPEFSSCLEKAMEESEPHILKLCGESTAELLRKESAKNISDFLTAEIQRKLEE